MTTPLSNLYLLASIRTATRFTPIPLTRQQLHTIDELMDDWLVTFAPSLETRSDYQRVELAIDEITAYVTGIGAELLRRNKPHQLRLMNHHYDWSGQVDPFQFEMYEWGFDDPDELIVETLYA